MGSNIIELAKLGHERAAELKASCGVVDVRSLAQLISDLATQLEVQFVRSTDMAVQLANAESKCRELAEFKSHVYAQMGAGCEAPVFAITEGLNNLHRFADTLHAIEREFFTKEVPDEECEGETVDECPLCWGMTVEQYVSEFGKCLAEVRAQGVEMYADNLDSGADDAERDGFDDAVKFLRSEASCVRLFAAQLRKGGAL
ncbi:eae-like domain protein [Salmonella enterica subsp. enterica serovar Bovismorbificans]|nr:eae-like domain protein [Salmonella enterica]EBU9534320.1 eae-like domain protein [Salmonella enterica subsp. enterica serovar Bovismorbificans]EAN8346101.1 eae-like domain protein [Salmonella enterica]EAR5411798.1 eae-like domain protein [Salmonella enterica]EAV4645826.1 eae-like domain protein [Salmonella enterica]